VNLDNNLNNQQHTPNPISLIPVPSSLLLSVAISQAIKMAT